MRAWILAFSVGVLSASYIPILPAWPVSMLCWLPVLLRYWWPRLHLAAAFCLGMWCLLAQAFMHQATLLPPVLEQVDLRIQAQIFSLPTPGVLTTRMTVKVNQGCVISAADCNSVPALNGIRIRLDDYAQGAYEPGQHWQFDVRLKRPHGVANPGSLDTERRLFAEKISATGYIRASSLLTSRTGNPYLGLQRWRYRFLAQLDARGLTSGAYIAALTVGEQSGLSETQRQLLQATGTSHLMVISGLHIGLVTWLVFQVSAFLYRQCMTNTSRFSARQLGGLMAVVGAFSYSLLAGFSLPVQRAFIMVCCLMSGIILERQTQALNNLCLALVLVLFLDPLAVRETGFWLSFGAVAVLLSRPGGTDTDSAATWRTRAGMLLQTQGRIFLGLLPLTLVFFGQVSLLAPLINLVAIPFIGLCIVPLCLFAMAGILLSPGIGHWLFLLPDVLLTWYAQGLGMLVAYSPIAVLRFPALSKPALGILVMAISVFLLARQLLVRSVAGIAVLLVLATGWFSRAALLPPGTLVVSVLDVGQGLAVVVRTRSHALVYDTGPALDDIRNTANFILLPFLRQARIAAPDKVVISHGDNDHAGGAAVLYRSFPKTGFLVGENLPGLPEASPCQAGQHWQWDQVDFQLLYPEAAGQTGNAASCVLKISTGPTSVLLPGDIEQAGELALVRIYRQALESTLLVAPHHGSSTSSTPPFVRHVRPGHVVFTTGYLNRFDHPRDNVVSRYTAIGSRIHITSATGMVQFRLSAGQGVESVTHYRETHPRFWADRP